MIQKTYFKTKDYCKVKFTIENTIAETVAIAGLNNDWETKIELKKKKDGSFSTEINLPKDSTHQFKYVINEQDWLNDDQADSYEPNVYGNTNSVLAI